MKALRNRTAAAALVFLAALTLQAGAPAVAADKVSLAYTQTLYSAHIIVAREKGYFAKQGIELDPKLFTAGRLTLDAVMAGAADMCATAETPMTAAVMAQRPIAVVARMAKATPTTLVNVDTGIRTLQDLKGKKLGVSIGSGSEVYLFNVLAKAGLKPADVTYVNLRPEDMPGALVNRSVDAINTWQPNISNAERLMAGKTRVLDTAGIYNETWDLVMMQDYLKTHEKQAVAMLRALLDAEAFIQANRAETMDILSRVVGIERGVVESSWSNFEFRVALDPALLEILQAHSRWRMETGNLPQGVTAIPDYRKVIFTGPLAAADPKRVTGF
jgi:ABC-type nitrate/sulfonate/bicarbonate transport system substrate-binding protein